MADERVREIERRLRTGGDPVEYVRNKIRTGKLTEWEIEVWAGLGNPGCMARRAFRSERGYEVTDYFTNSVGMVDTVDWCLGNRGLIFLAVAAAEIASEGNFPEVIRDLKLFLKADASQRNFRRGLAVGHLSKIPEPSREQSLRSAILAINTHGRKQKRIRHVMDAIAGIPLSSQRDVADVAGELWLTL